MVSTSTHTKWMKCKWIKIQCLETKGSSIRTYLITSYFTPPLASMDTNLLNTCIITSYFIHITCISSILITSYFTPPLASMDKNITRYHLVEWHWKSLSLVCMELISSIPNWSKRVLSISNILFNDPWSFNDDYEIW
jgi:hypothetical protein